MQPYLLIYLPTRPYTGVCLYTLSYQLHHGTACSQHQFLYRAAASCAREWGGCVLGSQFLLRCCISVWQFKFIWVWVEFLLRGTGWRMQFTLPRMDYHRLPTLARLTFRRSTTSSVFLHTIPQPKLLKGYLVGIQLWIFCWSSCGFSHNSPEYLAAM